MGKATCPNCGKTEIIYECKSCGKVQCSSCSSSHGFSNHCLNKGSICSPSDGKGFLKQIS